jgi:hypothetical protein
MNEVDYSKIKINGQPFYEFVEEGLIAIGFKQPEPNELLYQTPIEVSFCIDRNSNYFFDGFVYVSDNGKKMYCMVVHLGDKKFYRERPYNETEQTEIETLLQLVEKLAVRWSKFTSSDTPASEEERKIFDFAMKLWLLSSVVNNNFDYWEPITESKLLAKGIKWFWHRVGQLLP